MLTMQPVVPWPIALIMIREEFNYLGYLYKGECLGRAAAVPGVVTCSSVVLQLKTDVTILKWLSLDKKKYKTIENKMYVRYFYTNIVTTHR